MTKQMSNSYFNTPILLIIFNRPETTARVFEAIREIKPKQLFIAADAPRKSNEMDKKMCAEAKEVVGKIDWPCEIKTRFQKENLGCGLGPVTAINWFFEHVEQGVILEDDCVPNQSFFFFCQELLEYYRNNERIMHISGDNFQYGRKRGNTSYYFSEYTHNWGWATWKRAWKYYKFDIIDEKKRQHIWDKQWLLTVRKRRGLAILPNVNLVSNIGFGGNATHTQKVGPYSNMKAERMVFPLKHPRFIFANVFADYYTHRTLFKGNMKSFIENKIKNFLSKK